MKIDQLIGRLAMTRAHMGNVLVFTDGSGYECEPLLATEIVPGFTENETAYAYYYEFWHSSGGHHTTSAILITSS